MTAVRERVPPTGPDERDPVRDPDGTGPGGGPEIAAELGVLALALGTAAGFTRLFDTWSFLGRLAVPLLAAWAIALVLRRLGVRTLPATLLHLAVGIVLLTVMFAPGTHVLGVPTWTTLDTVSTNVTESFSAFSRLVAPVEPTDGFLVVIAAGLWIFALFADTAAFRYAGPVQAAIPYVSTFLATGILAREHGRTVASIWFLGGLLAYAVTERLLRSGDRRWVGRSGARGRRAVGATAAGLAVVALVGGLLLSPLLPGDTDPVVDLRDLGQGSGPRTVVSPFVGLRALLGVRSDTVMFDVWSDQPAYWRLTALEQFDADRDIWVSKGTYRRTDGDLPSDLASELPSSPLRQHFSIRGLSGLWLPGAYEPHEIATETPVNYDRESASIILRGERDGSSLDYRLDSVLPDFEAAREAPAGSRDELGAEYFAYPPLTAGPASLLDEIDDPSQSDFDRALALQNWFRDGFLYDESVDYRDEADPLAAFLDQRSGFCQQFSSAFALMARAIGLPARVAVGFTPGDAVEPTDEPPEGASATQYVVRGRHAHAWPEVYFSGVGWVPFEPTPSRGDPQASELTGVAAEQAAPPAPQAATTTTAVTPEAGEGTVPTTTPSGEVETVAPDVEEAADDDGGGGTGWLVAAVLVVVAAVAACVAWSARRRGRRRRSLARGGRVGDAWQRSAAWLALVDVQLEPHETPHEFAARAAHELERHRDGLGADEADAADVSDLAEVRRALDTLARIETDRRYGIDLPGPTAEAAADEAADRIESYVRASTSTLRRVEMFVRS